MRVLRVIRFIVVIVAHSVYTTLTRRGLEARARYKYLSQRQRLTCAALARTLRISTEVVGDIPQGIPMLVVTNHIGQFDPWVVGSQFDFAFVAKSEMGSWPVLGAIFRAVGMIFVDRKKIMTTVGTVNEIQDRMRDGIPVLIFPEGTTSDGRQVNAFKTTGFQAVANMEDGYILPVYFHVRTIDGKKVDLETRTQITWTEPQSMVSNIKQIMALGPVHYVVRIGAPIPSSGLDRKELARLSHTAVVELMMDEIKELSPSSDTSVEETRNELAPVGT